MSKHSDKLREKMGSLIGRQKALIEKADAESRDMTEAENTEFDSVQKEYDTTKVAYARAVALEAAEAEHKAALKASTSDATGLIEKATGASGGSPFMNGQRELTGFEKAGVAVWGAAKAKHYPNKTPHEHIADAGFQKVADECREAGDFIKGKSWLTTGGSTGGNVITTPLSTEFIAWLGNASAFMAGQPQQIDLSYGTLDMAGGNARTSGSYTAEGASIPYTEATTRKVSLAAKHLRAATAMGNHALEVSPLAVASLVGEELASSMTLSMDAAGLRGDGSPPNPAGLKTLINAAHKYDAVNATAPTVAQVEADVRKALTLLSATNIPAIRRRWIMCTRTREYLAFLRDGNGNFVYPGLNEANPTWIRGTPVIVSEQVPSTLGAGTNESEIYLVDFAHVLLGITRSLTLKASTEASYKNGGGTLVSAFDLDETVIRATASHDFDMKHDKAGVMLTAVKWGA